MLDQAKDWPGGFSFGISGAAVALIVTAALTSFAKLRLRDTLAGVALSGGAAPFFPGWLTITLAAVMAVIVRAVDWAIAVPDRDALAVLLPVGIASYLAMCWLLDIANSRAYANRARLLVRNVVSQREKRIAAAAGTRAKELP